MKLAYVEWEDAADLDDSPWAFHDDSFMYQPVVAHQVGFVLYDGPEGMVLTSSYIGDDTYGCRSQIPRGMIRSVTIIDDND
jgi:hypothetical protein